MSEIKGLRVAEVMEIVNIKKKMEKNDMETENKHVSLVNEDNVIVADNANIAEEIVTDQKDREVNCRVKKVSDSEAILSKTSNSELFIRAVKSRKASLKYLIYEKFNGESDDLENKDGLVSPDQVLNGATKLRKIIQNMQGNYECEMNLIILTITKIVKKRILVPVTADADVLSPETILVELKNWFENHLFDNRVGLFEMNGIHLALVKRGEKTPYQIFQEVMREIAPANKASAIKDWLYRNNLLVHDTNNDCNDTQLTLSSYVIGDLGVTGDKCISFRFEEKYLKLLYEMYKFELDCLEIDINDLLDDDNLSA